MTRDQCLSREAWCTGLPGRLLWEVRLFGRMSSKHTRVSKEWKSRDTDNSVVDVKSVKDAMPFGYTNVDITARDVYECAKRFPELKKVKSCVIPDGVKDVHTKIQLLCLFGTIPVKIGKDTYNIPVSIYMKTNHPQSSPYCLVMPTNDMAIQPSCHVDSHGLLHLSYLSEWKPNTSNLTDLVQELITTFERQCPLYSLSAALKIHLEIFDRLLSVKRITFTTVRSHTVYGIKVLAQEAIQETAGVPPDQQSLIYSGMVLENNSKMSDYYVQNEITLQLVINDVIPSNLCPLIPVMTGQADRLKQQLLTELQDQAIRQGDVTGMPQDSVAALQQRLSDVEEQSVKLQQQLDAEKQNSKMLQAKCQHLEDTVITDLMKRLEILERTAKSIS